MAQNWLAIAAFAFIASPALGVVHYLAIAPIVRRIRKK